MIALDSGVRANGPLPSSPGFLAVDSLRLTHSSNQKADLTPRRVAYECCYYKKLPRAMIPDLIRLTRKIKARLRMRLKRKGVPEAVVIKKRSPIRPEDKAPDDDRVREGEEFILSLSKEAKRLSSFALEEQVQIMNMWLGSVREKDPSLAEEILFLLSNGEEGEIEFREVG